MSREQDLLFCRIAIQGGKVTQEAAQECLTLANRYETEGKRRPQVGSLFLQQNLLSKEDVQRIYGAVQKRMESHSPSAENAASAAATLVREQRRAARPPAARTASRPGAPAPPGPSRAVRVTHRPVEAKMDATQLYLGIGFVVVFLICLGALIFILVGKPPQEPKVFTGGIPAKPGASTAPPSAPPAILPEKSPAKAAADAKAAIEKAIGKAPVGAKKAEATEKSTSEKNTEKNGPPPAGSPTAPAADRLGGPGGADGKKGVE